MLEELSGLDATSGDARHSFLWSIRDIQNLISQGIKTSKLSLVMRSKQIHEEN